MKFSVFISPKAIRSKLAASTKEGVISEMVDALVEAGEVKEADRADIIKAIMKREELGSTGIGRGVAVIARRQLLSPASSIQDSRRHSAVVG